MTSSFNETITVIVPVYNASKFIKKCVFSILNQTYNDLQLILVNDGSTDNSLKICMQCAAKDRRILVLSQENKGVSAARNYAMQHMIGKYVTFVDADDWLPRDSLESLYTSLKNCNAEFVVGSMRRIEPVKSYDELLRDLTFDASACTQETVAFFENMFFYAHVAKKLLYADIIIDNSITFLTDVKCAEDTCFMLDYLAYCNRVISIRKVVYHHNRLFELTGSTRYYKNRQDWSLQVLIRYRKCIEHFADKKTADLLTCREAIRQTNRVNLKHMMCGEPTLSTLERVNATYELLSRFVPKKYLLSNSNNEDEMCYITVLELLNSPSKYSEYVSTEFKHNSRNVFSSCKKAIKCLITVFKYLWFFKINLKAMTK